MKNVPLHRNGHHYLLPVHMESPCGLKSTGDQPGLLLHRFLKWQSIFFMKNSFFIKVEMLRFHKLGNFCLSLVYFYVTGFHPESVSDCVPNKSMV